MGRFESKSWKLSFSEMATGRECDFVGLHTLWDRMEVILVNCIDVPVPARLQINPVLDIMSCTSPVLVKNTSSHGGSV